MENNPFKKIVTGAVIATEVAAGSAQAAEATNQAVDTENQTHIAIESQTQIEKDKNAVEAFEKELSSGKKTEIAATPIAAIYSQDYIQKQMPFISSPQFSSNFWASSLEANLVSMDQSNMYLDRSQEGKLAMQEENKLIDDGFIAPNSAPEMQYFSPQKKVIVSVDQNSNTVQAVIYEKGSEKQDTIVAVQIEEDVNKTLENLTSQVLEALQ